MLFVSVAPESVGVAAATLVGPPLIGNGADRPPAPDKPAGSCGATAVFAQSQEWSFERNDGRCCAIQRLRTTGTKPPGHQTAIGNAETTCRARHAVAIPEPSRSGRRTGPGQPNQPDQLATVEFSPIDHVTAGQRNRAQAILQRRTDRLPFDSPMYWHLFEPALRDAVDKDVAMLDVVSDDQRTRLVVASQLSEVLRRDDPYYHAELEWWTSPFVLAHGVPPDTLASDAERLRVDLGRDFPVRSYQNRRAELADDRSKVLVLSTPSDTRADALRCGEVLSTILLECTMAGMATCTLTHLIESSDSRDIVRGLTRQRGEPQALIRVGIAPPLAAVPAPTPRRPLDSVLQIRQTPEKGRNASDRNARETGWFSPP